jgi:hypothetical protein
VLGEDLPVITQFVSETAVPVGVFRRREISVYEPMEERYRQPTLPRDWNTAFPGRTLWEASAGFAVVELFYCIEFTAS